jgi:hypothetical protein
MPDEEMDNMDELIREASKSHHPAYDDKAWEKMEALLDKHLPLNKDRRRPAIFFLFPLFIAGTVFFAILYQPGHKKVPVFGESKPVDIPIQGTTANEQPANGRVLTKTPMDSKDREKRFLQGINKKVTRGDFKRRLQGTHSGIKRIDIKTISPDAMSDFTDNKDIKIKSDKSLPEKDEPVFTGNKNTVPASTTGGVIDQLVDNSLLTLKKDSPVIVASKDITKAAIPAPPGKSPPRQPVKKGFANNFAINLSAGPDLSFVRLGDPGKSRLTYGAGLSYTFANRVTVRTGFYIAKKIYAAEPADYHPPGWYWTYNTDLKKVDADCKVYEIPLVASYNFRQLKNHNWFAGVGFSTFLMKRETYNYLYKDAWGQTRNKSWTLLNGGNNYFSVLTISGGYQYRINHYFSILAEPYLKLPLQGIGFGKIKLNSGGLLFTASIRPFAKRK